MTDRRKQVGATLLIIIIAMIVIAVLGIAMYALISTARLNQVVAQRAAKAFYLSESGIRIAASEYKNSTNKNNTLVNLHSTVTAPKEFILPDNVSKFKLEIYPYWFYAAAGAPTDATTLYLPGGTPPIDDTSTTPITLPSTGLLKIDDLARSSSPQHPWGGANYALYNSASISPSFDTAKGTMVTFTFSKPFPSPIITGDVFYIGNSYTVIQTPSHFGGDLILALDSTDTNDNSAKIFPPKQGTIFVASAALYLYDLRIITTTYTPHTVKLTNIQAITTGAPVPQPTSPAQIYVGKNIGFKSTSTYGE